MKWLLFSLLLFICMFIIGSDVWASTYNQMWADYFKKCSEHWSEACEKIYQEDTKKECDRNNKIRARLNLRMACRPLNEGR